MGTHQTTIQADQGRLGSDQDAQMARLSHLTPANPAPHGDRAAGKLIERLGRDSIGRWLPATPPELCHDQGRDHDWHQLRQPATTFQPGTGDVDPPGWHHRTWVPRADHGQGQADER